MSSFLFPYSLPGIQYNYTRKYSWGKQGVQIALTSKTSTIGYMLFPVIEYEYSFEFLRDRVSATPDVSALVGLYNAVKARYDTFLHTDPDFNTITSGNAAQYGVFGIGTGSLLTFQLLATYQQSGGPGNPEMVQNLNGTPVLYDNGTIISAANYSIGATGIVTFGAGHAPASGHTLTWSGSWYNRCRFDSDDYDFKRMDSKLWVLEKVNFTSLYLT